MIEELKCIICLELADKAVESQCCNLIACEECADRLSKCPHGCHSTFVTKPSVLARRLIGNIERECPNNDCLEVVTMSNLQAHLSRCQKSLIKCPIEGCSFHHTRQAFGNHLLNLHTDTVIDNVIEFYSVKEPNDRIATKRNKAGYEARLGSTGKYYCSTPLSYPCLCCNGYCGPTNGCNCPPCMLLDVKARMLPKGWLVNREGFACRRGDDQRFYCGRKVMTSRQTDGYCGPTNGLNCVSCQTIDSQFNLYKNACM